MGTSGFDLVYAVTQTLIFKIISFCAIGRLSTSNSNFVFKICFHFQNVVSFSKYVFIFKMCFRFQNMFSFSKCENFVKGFVDFLIFPKHNCKQKFVNKICTVTLKGCADEVILKMTKYI